MITVSLEPKWRHFAQVNIADIFMLSSKLPKQNENIKQTINYMCLQCCVMNLHVASILLFDMEKKGP